MLGAAEEEAREGAAGNTVEDRSQSPPAVETWTGGHEAGEGEGEEGGYEGRGEGEGEGEYLEGTGEQDYNGEGEPEGEGDGAAEA